MKPGIAILALLLTPAIGHADDFAALCADRTALERVYHDHRTGTKRPFEEVMPRALIESLTRQELRKEAALRKTYLEAITPAMLAAEVERINSTTRAPEILAELKHALGDDAERFARSMARPILVERELRRHFDNDDKLHAEQRHQAELARASLLAGRPVTGMQDVIWQLTPRPADLADNPAKHTLAPAGAPAQEVAKSPSYSVEASAQVSQTIAAPAAAGRESNAQKQYLDDLDPQLQKLLRMQLEKPGAVSAVVETPAGFVVFQAKQRSATELTAASLSIHKRGYDEWLAQQPESTP